MPRESLSTRLAAATALLLAAGALSAPAASATPVELASSDAYVLTVSTNPAGTDSDDRGVDGSPAPDIPVAVQEIVLFTSGNPWGDPIDPDYYEARDLGTPVTGVDGKFTIPGVDIDHVTGSGLLNVQHGVRITASTTRMATPTPRRTPITRTPPRRPMPGPAPSVTRSTRRR